MQFIYLSLFAMAAPLGFVISDIILSNVSISFTGLATSFLPKAAGYAQKVQGNVQPRMASTEFSVIYAFGFSKSRRGIGRLEIETHSDDSRYTGFKSLFK